MNSDKAPEDSVLRRHYETQKKMAGDAGDKTAPGAGQQPSGSHSSSRSSSSGKGFMGWLKRLFGG
jgi:hypothetical protein